MLNKPRYINAGGKLIDLEIPKVMGILNVTPDSFYKGSRYIKDSDLIAAAGKMLGDGAAILDVGGYSSRPGADVVPQEEESKRVMHAIKIILREFPEAVVSVDTFRPDIALSAVEEAGALMINDISGGDADNRMFSAIGRLNVPYIMMHMKGTPATMQNNPVYDDIIADILKYFGDRIFNLRSLGVKDIILDPGFGFAKTIAHNFELMRRFSDLAITGLPLMAGISRKSMIWRTLQVTPDEALNGTTVLNTVALLQGADILRVHDVREAVEAIRILTNLKE